MLYHVIFLRVPFWLVTSPMKNRQVLIGAAAFWVWPNLHDS